MAICEVCGGEMLKVNGCKRAPIIHDGKEYDHIKYGEEKRDYGVKKGQRCGDCGAMPGYYHHKWCDIERCPVCGGQLLSCDCDENSDNRDCGDE